jgi:predicted RNase H-like HicB family nuclease
MGLVVRIVNGQGCEEGIVKDYHINIFYSEDDRYYVADIPDLRHCSGFGATPEDALREVQIAKDAWLKAAKKSRKKIPQPKYRPATD